MEENVKTTVSKNKEGYGYKYTDLAQIHEYLESIDAKYIQQVKRIENDDYVMTKRCFKDVWEEDWLQGAKIVDAVLNGIKNPAQEQGSALTYARRYSLLMAFGLATEDDDGASLTKNTIETKEDAEKVVLTFGKHKGKTLGEVVENDSKYIDWMINSDKIDDNIKHCITLITGVVPLSQEEQEDVLNKMLELNNLLEATSTDRDKFYKYYKVTSNKDMTLEQLNDGIEKLKKKLPKEVTPNDF